VTLGAVIEAARGRLAVEFLPARRFSPPAARRPAAARAPGPNAFPEIDCLRDILPAELLAAAERHASAIGLGADQVLIAADAITEDAYLAALARSLGLAYTRLDDVRRTDCPLGDDQLIQAAAAGLLPLRQNPGIVWLVAPRCLAARRLPLFIETHPELRRRLAITSTQQLRRFAARHAQDALGRRAADGLRLAWPLLSSAPQAPPRPFVAAGALMVLTAFALLPIDTNTIVNTAACLVFLAAAMLRLSTALFAPRPPPPAARTADDRLPIYTIICALYREASVVEGLVAAIRRLDYPVEKLDVKFVLEPDDHETLRAVAGLDLGPPFEILVAPDFGPRTKPKALNAALSFARGTFTVIYDAEDRPQTYQLRSVLDVFMAADERLACVQARLSIDNTADGWLTRMFTADYAGQFDVFLPGLAALHLPLPLGGSSNHFRTAVLREIGGWDAYNVTEDADLGMRLARFGYRSATAASTTYEEAPARFGPWLRQRTRWFKGWMQTWLVHMRTPRRLVRELGPAGALTFHLVIGGNVLAALSHPIFLAGLCYLLLRQPSLRDGEISADTLLFAATFLSGYVASIVLGAVGLRRRNLLATSWVLALMPLHWLLLSLAAWRALFQLVLHPHHWEKTEHGLAKTSRTADGFAADAP
jgi:cellulose synthase/poly-beta-1,6-N-acetylglucosamine synthase-like glycosyltransferase